MTIVSTTDRERLRHSILKVLPTLGECPEKHLLGLTLALIADVEQQENTLQCINGMIDVTGKMGEMLCSFLSGLPPEALPEDYREGHALLVDNFATLRKSIYHLKEALSQMQSAPSAATLQ